MDEEWGDILRQTVSYLTCKDSFTLEEVCTAQGIVDTMKAKNKLMKGEKDEINTESNFSSGTGGMPDF